MAKSSAARAAARFKQLCCLGLDSEAVVPALLHELHELIPSLANTFYFLDEAGTTTHIYLENTEYLPLLPVYWQIVHDRDDRRFKGLAFSEAARTLYGVHTFETAVKADRAAYHRSDAYNLTERVVGYDNNFLRLVLRHGRRPVGGVRLWRSIGSGTWTPEEMRQLAALEPFFIHALTVHDGGETPLVESDAIGLIVASPEGKPIHFSTEGRRLLFLATHPRNGPDTVFSPPESLPVRLVRLCRDLGRVFSADRSAAAPTYYCRNVWGGFSFRAQWMGGNDSQSGLIGITVTHKEPLPVRLVHRVESLPLSRRQAEVCVLIASGHSRESIADRLGISRHTANEHGRWIYNKLNVHSRAELVNKLLFAAA